MSSGLGAISSAAPYVGLAGNLASTYSQYQSTQQQGEFANQAGEAQAQAYAYNAEVSRMQAEAAAKAYEYNAAISRANSAVAVQNARQTLEVAQVEAGESRRAGVAAIASEKTQMIASGVAMEGTALLIIDEDTRRTTNETNKILMQGDQQARNFMIESANLEAEARMNEYNAQVSRISGNNRASSELQQAAVSRYQGQTQQYMANKQASTSMWTGLSSAFGQFGSLLGGKK